MATVLLTQANRPIRVDTQLGPDVLLLTGFNGVEAVSQPFVFQLELLSLLPDVDPAALLRQPVLVAIRLDNGETRYIHGLCSRFSQGHQRDNLTSYRAEIVPWLWFLRLSRESRIYQDLTAPEIIEQVFKRLGYTDFDNRLLRSYGQRGYCVQYRETHLDFISRLMEEEGIFYFFEHTDEKHVLVLCDDNSASEPGPTAETARFTMEDSRTDEVIWGLEREHTVHVGMVTLSDYDPLQPTLDLERSEGDSELEEIYDYPGVYANRSSQRDPEDGERLARIWLEAEEAERQVVRGQGNVRGLVPGYHFTLEEHYRGDLNTKYMVTRVHHFATSGEFRAWNTETPLDYRNDFHTIPHDTPYRPRRRTRRPLIYGSQSAVVVGPPGEEVHVDKYGRVKLQFYWDRDGQRNENSSCWVRVATPWAGKGYGSVSIPRIGDEVIVAFEEGDPDRPIIIGSVYNADHMPPFGLPGAGIQMGMKSRSSPGGGGTNEITMTDTKGKEMMNIHAQYDMATTVENDQANTINNDQTNTVNNNRITSVAVDDTASVGSNQSTSVDGDQSTTVGGKQDTQVGGNCSLSVGGNQDVSISGNESSATAGDRSVSVGGKEDATVGGNQVVGVGGNQTVTISGNGELAVGASHEVSAGAQIKIEAGATIEISAGAKISLSAGGSMIEIGPAGITIQTGALVTVQGSTIKLN